MRYSPKHTHDLMTGQVSYDSLTDEEIQQRDQERQHSEQFEALRRTLIEQFAADCARLKGMRVSELNDSEMRLLIHLLLGVLGGLNLNAEIDLSEWHKL